MGAWPSLENLNNLDSLSTQPTQMNQTRPAAHNGGFAIYSVRYSDTTWPSSYDTYSFPLPPKKDEIQSIIERLFDKGKYFRFRTSMEYRRWFGEPPLPVKQEPRPWNPYLRSPSRAPTFRSSAYTQFGRFRPRARTR